MSKIENDVKAYVASYSHLAIGLIQDGHVLAKPPLNLDDTALAFLAGSLRSYVRHYKPSATVLASEVRKKGLTVKLLIDLITNKLN
ncbi:hypothetical protein ACLI09_17820 [Flavobacterium sp. RHBU_24]|uniref:hypothetical protein n=1 Tax=Flavobacterium sp. RHBU_24 TaxID=3391185 RepID=UPI003984D29F